MSIPFEESLSSFIDSSSDKTNSYNSIGSPKINLENIVTKKVKRYLITVIKETFDKSLASYLKKALACGGSVTKEGILLQGNHKGKCIQILKELELLENH